MKYVIEDLVLFLVGIGRLERHHVALLRYM